MLNLGFVDDLQMRHTALRIPNGVSLINRYSGEELVRHMTEHRGRFDLLFLDHDLADTHYPAGDPLARLSRNQQTPDAHFMNGKEVCHFLGVLPDEKRPLCVVVHTWNAQAQRDMQRILKSYGYDPFVIPFSFEPGWVKGVIEKTLAA